MPLLASCLFIRIYGERDGKGHRFYRRLSRFTAYNANQTVTPAAVKTRPHDDEARTLATGLMPQSPAPVPACSPTDAAQAAPKPEVGVSARVPVLDGLRGIAILLVMVFHFWSYGVVFGGTLWDRVYSRAAGVGWAGVDLFFVLSGFLITGILYDSRNDAHYYRVF